MKANQASKIKNDAAVSRVRRVQLQEKIAQKQKELEIEEIKARAEAENKIKEEKIFIEKNLNQLEQDLRFFRSKIVEAILYSSNFVALDLDFFNRVKDRVEIINGLVGLKVNGLVKLPAIFQYLNSKNQHGVVSLEPILAAYKDKFSFHAEKFGITMENFRASELKSKIYSTLMSFNFEKNISIGQIDEDILRHLSEKVVAGKQLTYDELVFVVALLRKDMIEVLDSYADVLWLLDEAGSEPSNYLSNLHEAIVFLEADDLFKKTIICWPGPGPDWNEIIGTVLTRGYLGSNELCSDWKSSSKDLLNNKKLIDWLVQLVKFGFWRDMFDVISEVAAKEHTSCVVSIELERVKVKTQGKSINLPLIRSTLFKTTTELQEFFSNIFQLLDYKVDIDGATGHLVVSWD